MCLRSTRFARKGLSERSFPSLLFDLTLGITAAVCAIYLISMEDAIYARGVHLSTTEWIAGTILIFTAIEFTRRTTGLIIPVLIIVALTYVGWWGSMVGGVFKFSGLTPETILFRSVYGDDGLFGNIARISSTFVFMFILFGAFLLRSGAGRIRHQSGPGCCRSVCRRSWAGSRVCLRLDRKPFRALLLPIRHQPG